MKKYLFILGRDIELSLLELVSYFQKNSLHYKIDSMFENLVFVSIEQNFKPQTAIERLGGTVKIGEIIKDLKDIYQGKENKIKYAISSYGNTDISHLQKELKTIFKKQKLKAFYKKPKRESFLMPSEVIKQKLVEEGIEILAYKNHLARTVAVFNPMEHEKRDKEMPCKDYLKTISIRLAKILINLSQAKSSLLDPFCGYGVIMQEAILQGINARGLDIDQKSVDASKKNLGFITKKHRLKAKYEVIRGNSRELSKWVRRADGIATEPFLGPFLKKYPDYNEAVNTMKKLEQMYHQMLREAKKVVKGKIAIIVPRFPTRQRKEVTMDFKKIIKETGFKICNLRKDIQIPITYLNGKIVREIWVIEG